MFTQFEEGNLLSEYCNGTESGEKYDDNSILPLLISKAEIYEMSLGDKYDTETMYTDMLEDIHDKSQSHMRMNRREAR